MPELPEVITVSRSLNDSVSNKTFKDIKVYEPKMIKEVEVEEFKNFLINETIIKIDNYGKNIIYHLTNDKYLISHLRMTGKYNTYHTYRDASKHDYVVFYFTDGTALYYNDSRKFGTFHIKTSQTLMSTNPLKKLGSYAKDINIETFHQKLQNKSIPIKQVLLDQSYVIGIGNIYANEALFASKISPLTPAKNLNKNDLELILKNADEIMQRSLEYGGSSIDSYTSINGVKGEFQNFLKVHGKDYRPCPNCQNQIAKIFINKRGTYYCLKCQKIK